MFLTLECLYYSMGSNEIGMMNDSGAISLTTWSIRLIIFLENKVEAPPSVCDTYKL